MLSTKICEGVSDISDSYMGFLIDPSVLHDGTQLHEGVLSVFHEMEERKKFVILLSNSDQRANTLKENLKKIGLGPSLYQKCITAGEFFHEGMKDRTDTLFYDVGRKFFLFGLNEKHPALEDLDIECVDTVKDAEAILIHGMGKLAKPIHELDADLREIARRRMKIFCFYPDSRGLIFSNYIMGMGLVVRRLQEMGAVVNFIGKPYKPVFNYCTKLLQEQGIFPAQSVIIGDTMAHDILGGMLAGMDSCLIRTGLHAGAFRQVKSLKDLEKAISTLVAQYNNARPTYLADRFKWGKALPDRKHRKRKAGARERKVRLSPRI
ncbi:MAG: TIGR01459 family HAD-type hydrolase [Alphaproteobacteria bacterium]|nr:TIGR01459 family HAD-type hydrolase [Alphaproteobacteria bacterium]